MTILENNKLIAKFMGGKQTDRGYFIPYWCIVNMASIDLGRGKISKYHTSWDWLMPVVEKIESLGYNLHISKKGIMLTEGGLLTPGICFYSEGRDTKLQGVYRCVVDFIKWYNKQDKDEIKY